MKFDAYQMVTDRICELLEQGFIPWDKPWAMAKTCAWSGNDGHAYTLLNQFLLADPAKKYKSYDELVEDIAGEWVTFHQTLDRGGNVKKGEHGRRVVFFSMVPKKDEDGNETGIIPVIKWNTVFKISQCEGVEQKWHTDAGQLYEFNPNQTADEVANGYIARENVGFVSKKSDKACYSPSTDTVTMPLPEQFRDSNEYYATLFHELTHSTGNQKRLNRITRTAAFGDADYSAEELVAEIGSASIMATIGLENSRTFRNSTAYVQNWLKALRNDKRLIVTASAKAEKALKLIFNIKEGVEG